MWLWLCKRHQARYICWRPEKKLTLTWWTSTFSSSLFSIKKRQRAAIELYRGMCFKGSGRNDDERMMEQQQQEEVMATQEPRTALHCTVSFLLSGEGKVQWRKFCSILHSPAMLRCIHPVGTCDSFLRRKEGLDPILEKVKTAVVVILRRNYKP